MGGPESCGSPWGEGMRGGAKVVSEADTPLVLYAQAFRVTACRCGDQRDARVGRCKSQ